MKEILMLIKKHKTDWIRLGLALILLTGLALLTSCSSVPDFPAEFIYEVDLQSQVCGKYKIVDKNRLLVEHVIDLPIGVCNGVFGFSTEDTPKVFDWSRDLIELCKRKCSN